MKICEGRALLDHRLHTQDCAQVGSKTAVGLEVGTLVNRLLTEMCGVLGLSFLLWLLKVLGWGREKALLVEEDWGWGRT